MTAGAVGFPRRRFVGFDAIASLTWALSPPQSASGPEADPLVDVLKIVGEGLSIAPLIS